MIFEPTAIPGAFLIKVQPARDMRGYFARTFCVEEFNAHGLDPRMVQGSVSFNKRRGTLRGMHYQVAPHSENKLVSCMHGSIYDVIVDLRRDSPMYLRWLSFTLAADSLDGLFIPAGCAHGFITLEDDCLVRYDISAFYQPAHARGVRYDDPTFAIDWPLAPTVVSPRDLSFPPYGEG